MSDLSSQQEKMTTTNNTTARRGINRRHFLKASAVGAVGAVGAGALAAMPTFDTAERVSAAPPTQGGGEGRLDQKDESDPLAPDKLPDVAETWAEPWTWRPSDWPGQSLPLHVVENAAPMAITGTSFNNAQPLLFSYNGTTPGPTIRMKGDETLFIHLRNMLGPDLGKTPVGVYSDIGALLPGPEGALLDAKRQNDPFGDGEGQVPAEVREDWCLGEHTNGVHSNHVTNLHTHGLHVRPATNPDGTHSDNVILRIMPQDDWKRRETDIDASCRFIREDEVVGQARYEFRLGNVQDNPKQPHPAGTFWYHPHCHGATHNQVAGGMAGFLIVEGDIEDALYNALVDVIPAGTKDSDLKNPVYKLPYDPSRRTGPFDYRERLMLIQRVSVTAKDPDAPTENIGPRDKKVIFDTANGSFEPRIITMRPGAIERWRILNGSVDGKSYLRFMVLKGRYEYKVIDTTLPAEQQKKALFEINDGQSDTQITSMAKLSDKKHRLWLLAWDGITLVQQTNTDKIEYYIQDLQFKAEKDPLVMNPTNNAFTKESIDACYKAGRVKNAYVRPNELDMSPANRADILIQAPILDKKTPAEIYTVVAMGTPLHADGGPRPDTIVAYLIVSGDKVEGMAKIDDHKKLSDLKLPPVADYLKPITNNELKVLPPSEVSRQLPPQQRHALQNEIKEYNQTVDDQTENSVPKRTKVAQNNYRTRKITYSGWGAADFPLVPVPGKYVEEHPDQQKLRYYKAPDSVTIPAVTLPSGKKIAALTITNLRQPDGSPLPTLLLPPGTRTMAIDGRKFNPKDPVHPQMLWWTAEEWMLTNNSTTLWRDPKELPLLFTGTGVPTHDRVELSLSQLNEAVNYNPTDPKLKEALALYKQFEKSSKDPSTGDTLEPEIYVYWPHYTGYPITRSEANSKGYQLVTKAADHPFHMHQNPFWVMRIDVPDENGNLVNILDQPRWQDTIWIPRNGGRVIFRSRFPDYLGVYVNHCHLLLHEDNGMMQAVETVPTANSANYIPANEVLDKNNADRLYPTDSKNLGQAWLDSMQFIDPNPKTGQVYPGFELEVPTPNS